MNRRRLIQQHRLEIAAALARRGAYNLRLFGSVAHGEERDESDSDIIGMRNMIGQSVFRREPEPCLGGRGGRTTTLGAAVEKLLRDLSHPPEE